jgi:P-type Mg2+ transporter
VAPPPLFFVFLIGATIAYLALVEITKRVFYHFTAGRSPRATMDIVPG